VQQEWASGRLPAAAVGVIVVVLDILLFLAFVALPVAALCMQTIPMRLTGVTFHDTDLPHAWELVIAYAEGTFEQRFGYPTGYFAVEEKRTQRPTRVLMRELQPAGAVTDGCSMQLGAFSLSGLDEGCGAGCLMFCLVAAIAAPFWGISILDRFFRFMLRSRVDVQLQAAGPDSVASFAFYGPGGYSLRRRYAQVFAKPALPPELSAEPAAAPIAGPGAPVSPVAPAGPAASAGPVAPAGPAASAGPAAPEQRYAPRHSPRHAS
jgi:hypothetical protein